MFNSNKNIDTSRNKLATTRRYLRVGLNRPTGGITERYGLLKGYII